MIVTRELSFEGVETTVEPPVCDICGGSGVIRGLVDDAEIGCFACGGDEKQSGCGYERGDDASLLAMVQAMAAQEDAQGFPLTANQFSAMYDAERVERNLAPAKDLIAEKLASEAA